MTGTATWEGLLLGFTPELATVAGDAEVGVNLEDLTGTADFTDLESWAADTVPGEAGTGVTWGDGDLAYSIAVTGNTFRQTGGDDGFLTGAFFGESHEGMGGTLEREDLTAAVGRNARRPAWREFQSMVPLPVCVKISLGYSPVAWQQAGYTSEGA